MYVKFNGEKVFLWQPVDREGKTLESYVTKTRDKAAALSCMKKFMKRHGRVEAITIDGLRSYKAAPGELGCAHKQEVGRWANTGRERPLAVPTTRADYAAFPPAEELAEVRIRPR